MTTSTSRAKRSASALRTNVLDRRRPIGSRKRTLYLPLRFSIDATAAPSQDTSGTHEDTDWAQNGGQRRSPAVTGGQTKTTAEQVVYPLGGWRRRRESNPLRVMTPAGYWSNQSR